MADPSPAGDVLRGTCRWLLRAGISPIAELPLPNGRRVDIIGIDDRGLISIVEIKVSLADLRGDAKWPSYLDYCDCFYWAVPPGLPLADLHTPNFCPQETGLIVADRYDAELIRPAVPRALNAARRKTLTLAMARRAATRWLSLVDPEIATLGLD